MAEDLAERVQALEAENKMLKETLSDLAKRMSALEVSGAAAAAPVKKPRGSIRARPGTAKKSSTPSRRPGHGRRGSTGATPAKKPARRKPKLAERKTEDKTGSTAIPAERKKQYNVGKAQIHVVLPAETKIAREGKSPSSSLELDYIYGFNGKEARSNLHFSKSPGSVTYCVAGTGVVMDLATKTQQHFIGHNEDILCLAVHPTRPLVATGQQDPKGDGTPYICIWDEEKCAEEKKIVYHDRGVAAVAFSPDGKYLATVGNDDSHTMAIWDWEAKDTTPLHTHMVSKDEVSAIYFHSAPQSAPHLIVAIGPKLLKTFSIDMGTSIEQRAPSTFGQTKITQKAYNSAAFLADGSWVAATHSGHLYLFDATNTLVAFPEAHDAAVGAVAITEDQQIVSAASDGSIKVWPADCKAPAATHRFAEGKCIPRALAVHGNLAVVGSKDNAIRTVDLTTGEITVITEGHHKDVWGIAVHPTLPIMASTSSDKSLRLWDYKEKAPTQKATFRSDVKSAAFSPDGQFIAIGQENGKVALLDSSTLEVKWEKKFAAETVDTLDFSPDGKCLAAGSWDQSIHVITIPEGKRRANLKGHTSSVLHVNFSADGKYLMSNSRDYEILYWNLAKKSRETNKANVADLEWPNWNCFLGWPVMGIWKDADDGTDINSVDRHGDTLAVGDDFGLVRLYKWPCTGVKSPYKGYRGHSSHVMNVRFSPAGDHVFSAGGHDMAVFQWRHSA